MAAAKIKLEKNEARIWDLAMVREFVKQAQERVGSTGWRYLSHEMREALICQKALEVAIGMARGDISCAAISALRMDMLRVAGLIED